MTRRNLFKAAVAGVLGLLGVKAVPKYIGGLDLGHELDSAGWLIYHWPSGKVSKIPMYWGEIDPLTVGPLRGKAVRYTFVGKNFKSCQQP